MIYESGNHMMSEKGPYDKCVAPKCPLCESTNYTDIFWCPNCEDKSETIRCHQCGDKTEVKNECLECGQIWGDK